MSSFRRRPFDMGNTDVSVLSQPEIRGAEHKDSSGEFPALTALLPAELVIETEDPATSGGISAVFSDAGSMEHVLAQINSALASYATAEEYEGCVVIKSTGLGEGAYIRILQPIGGFDDASDALGFPVHPNPTATVSAGDLQDAPTRPLQQENPVGTKYIAAGEDRVGSAYNRALHRLGLNADQLYTWLRKPVARMLDLQVDETAWASYIDENADGTIDQINLSAALAALHPADDGRIYIDGNLSRLSTLDEIARFFAVLDDDHKEMMAGDRIVRIGAVTRGQRGATRPGFTNDISAPVPALSDTSGVSVDGNNALGVDREKHAAVQITEVRQRTVVYCETATFETSGVTAGDIAVIAGSLVDTPFNHSGDYIVETVVSETELVLRPSHDSGHVRELNPDDSASFGTVTIQSGGEWETDIWLTFEPPLPRFPVGNKIRLIVPVETPLGELPVDALVAGDIRTSEEVDGWVAENLWRQISYGGVYQGMNSSKGGGFFGSVTHRPITLVNRRAEDIDAVGTVDRSSSGAATLDLVTLRLTAHADDRFEPADVGRTILINAAPFLSDEPWVVVRFIDYATLELAPPVFRSGYTSTGTTSVTSWKLLDDDTYELASVLRIISPEHFGASDTDAGRAGYVFLREQRDQSTTDDLVPGAMSFLHLEKIRHHDDGSKTNITVFTSPSISGNTVEVGFDPEQSSNILAAIGDTKSFAFTGGITYLRILHGKNAGMYLVHQLTSAAGSGTNALIVLNLDGSTPAFDTEAAINCCLYNARVCTGSQVFAGPAAASNMHAALSLFEDAHGTDKSTLGVALRMGWRGVGAGLLILGNDPEFIALGNGDAANGEAINIFGYAPMDGILVDLEADADGTTDESRRVFGLRIKVLSTRNDFAYDAPTPSGAVLQANHAYGAWIHQGGRDPSTIITKSIDGGTGLPGAGYSKLTPSAAAIIAHARGSTGSGETFLKGIGGRGSALELRGSIYSYSDRNHQQGGGSWSPGGIFSEDVVGAGRWLYPMMGVYEPDDSPYQGTGTYAGWESPTQLGAPGRSYPITHPLASFPTADLQEPDYEIFNMPHAGMLYIADAAAIPFGGELEKPFHRFVGHRLKVVESGHAFEDELFVIMAVSTPNSEDEVYFALHHESSTVTGTEAGTIDFSIHGQRWRQGYLSIADWYLIGTAHPDFRDQIELLPLTMFQAQELNAWANILPDHGASDPDLDSLVLIGKVPWGGAADGVAISTPADDTSSLGGVDVDEGVYDSNITWTGRHYVEHPWAEEVKAPRVPFGNFASVASMGQNTPSTTEQTPDNPKLSDEYKGSLIVDDYAISFTGGGTDAEVQWKEAYSGCMAIVSSGATSTDLRIWQRGRALFAPQHFAVVVKLRVVNRMNLKDWTIALRTVAGTALAEETVTLNNVSTPQDIEVELKLSDIEDGPPSQLSKGFQGTQCCITIDIEVNDGDTDAYVLEWKAETLTRPKVITSPVIVSGPVLAHGYRFTNPVRGFDTRGPVDASFWNPTDFGFHEGYEEEVTGYDPKPDVYTSSQEIRGGPGLVMGSVGTSSWYYRPWYSLQDTFRKGVNAAVITLANGAFDPAWYVYKTHKLHIPGESIGDDVYSSDYLVWPGQAGFSVPFDPPHGAILTSLALSMSFRANYLQSDTAKHWGCWYAMADPDVASTVAANPAVSALLDRDTWDEAQGVQVELWRHNSLDFGVEEAKQGYFDEELPSMGFTERIARLKVRLKDVPTPDYDVNELDSTTPGAGQTGIYAGTEHFERRNWNLMLEIDEAQQHLLRVDRRHYSYFLTIRFWGGPRTWIVMDGQDGYGYPSSDAYPSVPSLSAVVPGSGGASGEALNTYVFQHEPPLVGIKGGDYEGFNFPPQVKFRGARLGWITDKGGHGGWGS